MKVKGDNSDTRPNVVRQGDKKCIDEAEDYFRGKAEGVNVSGQRPPKETGAGAGDKDR